MARWKGNFMYYKKCNIRHEPQVKGKPSRKEKVKINLPVGSHIGF